MTSSTQVKLQKKLKEQQKIDRVTDEEMAKAIMSTPRGRRWAWRFFERASIFQEDANTDFGRMAYYKGMREMALPWLRDCQKFAPKEFIDMIAENTGRDLTEEEEETDVGHESGTDA